MSQLTQARRACLKAAGRDARALLGCLERIDACTHEKAPPHGLPRIQTLSGRSDRNEAIYAFDHLCRLVGLAEANAFTGVTPFTTWDRLEGAPEHWRDFVLVYTEQAVALHRDLEQREKDSLAPLDLSSAVTGRLLSNANAPLQALARLEAERKPLLRQLDAARDTGNLAALRAARRALERNRDDQAARVFELLRVFFGAGPADDEDGPDAGEAVERLQVFLCYAVPNDRRSLPNFSNVLQRRSGVRGLVGDCCLEHCRNGRRSGSNGAGGDDA